jgi:LacI family transcriptional regulator
VRFFANQANCTTMPNRARIPHVAVWIETSRGYGRGLIQGVAEYLRHHGPWSIYFTPHGMRDPLPAWLRNWKGDGILARIDDRKTARLLLATKLPLIDLSCRIPGVNCPPLGPDNRLVAQLAFEHLRERGFHNYAFFGLPPGEHVHMDLRCDYFCELAVNAGYMCHVFQVRRKRGKLPDWEQEQKQLGHWLCGLPKPIGIMTCNDDRGQQLLDACRRADMAVPEQVAVVGVDNDQELCNLATRPLSSVDVNSRRIGYGAAAQLDRMMATGMTRPPSEVVFAPSHVVTRLSTDTIAVDDPALARALQFIRDHACKGISVDHVVRAAVTSRRHLERQMHALLGRSPNQEILRVRMRRAQELLLETDLSLQAIARETGFRSAKYLGDVFVRQLGQPPGQMRSQVRGTLRNNIDATR